VHDLNLPTNKDLILQNIHLKEGEKEKVLTELNEAKIINRNLIDDSILSSSLRDLGEQGADFIKNVKTLSHCYSFTFASEVNMLHAKVGSLLADRLMQIIYGEIVTPITK
jgi:hypothetical protein